MNKLPFKITKKSFFKIFNLLIVVFLSLTGCEQDDDENLMIINNAQSKIELSQKKYSIKNFKDNFIKDNIKINWNDFVIIEENQSSSIYQFSTNLRSTLSLNENKSSKKNKPKKLYSTTKLVAEVNSDGIVAYQIVKFLGNDKNKLKNVDIQESPNFTGTITYYGIKGAKLKTEFLDNGVLTLLGDQILSMTELTIFQIGIGANFTMNFRGLDYMIQLKDKNMFKV